MAKDPTEIEGPALGPMVYAQALERIAALAGCLEDTPEERELIHWAEIADRLDRWSGNWPRVRATVALPGPGPAFPLRFVNPLAAASNIGPAGARCP